VAQIASDIDGDCPRLALQQALGCQHVSDFSGSDAKSQSPKSSVRAGVTVATHNRHSGLRESKFRSNDVHNAAASILQVKQLDAVVRGVSAKLTDLVSYRRGGEGF
jgi:hypothetical protein